MNAATRRLGGVLPKGKASGFLFHFHGRTDLRCPIHKIHTFVGGQFSCTTNWQFAVLCKGSEGAFQRKTDSSEQAGKKPKKP